MKQQRETELERMRREARRDAHIQAAYELHGWSATAGTDPLDIILMLELNDYNDDILENDND